MYVNKGARLGNLIREQRWTLTALLTLALVTGFLGEYVAGVELFSVVYVGVFSTALSIFLVFRFNEAYERWWEARKLWGALVNESRNFARQVQTLLDDEARRSEGTGLVRRQIAFVHGLRIHLRQGSSDRGREELHTELTRIVPDEAPELMQHANVLNALLRRQGERLAAHLSSSTAERVLLTRFDETLGRMHDIQGACERIKNTVFPDAVTTITRVLVWGLVVLLMLATVETQGRGGPVEIFAVCVMSMGYIWIDAMGQSLKNPFEGQPNDTPMTALSTSIERDLRELLGETELPAPVQPVDGVLM